MTASSAQLEAAPCPHCGYDLRELRSDVCPNCGRRLTWVDGGAQFSVRWIDLLRSLALRVLVAAPLALGLTIASVWCSKSLGSARIATTPAIIFGVLHGYGFAFGLASRARRVNVIVWIIVILAIAGVATLGIVATQMLAPNLVASAGDKRFWFGAAAFAGTSIMCALLALGYESKGPSEKVSDTGV